MTTLTAAVLLLRPVEPCAVPRWNGPQVRAWFLGQVRAHNPLLADEMQQGDALRPYTASSLIGVRGRRNEPVELDLQRHYAIRVTTLLTPLSELLTETVLPQWAGQQVVIGDVPFVVDMATADMGQHPWAGTCTDAELIQRHTLESDGLGRRIELTFDSPSVFRKQNGHVLPFPLPELVFGSLIDQWNTFNEVRLHPDARRFADECVVPNAYQLRTLTITLNMASRDQLMTGLVGHCRYVVLQGDRYWRGVVHTLAGYAFFAGVGSYSTMGLGRVALSDESRVWWPPKPTVE